MSNDAKFEWRLGSPCLENYADPPEDTLGELSHFELGLRRFCYECNREVSIEIDGEKIQVFLDPDICMLLEDELPKKIGKLLNNKPTEIEFVESCCFAIQLVPIGSQISCNLKEFGYLVPNNFTLRYRKKSLELDRTQVLVELKQFVNKVMQMAVDGGYITTKEQQEFLMPIADIVSPSVFYQ
jgi:hypothetical protein